MKPPIKKKIEKLLPQPIRTPIRNTVYGNFDTDETLPLTKSKKK